VGFKEKIKIFWPAGLVFLIAAGFVVWRLSLKEWDPLALAELGSRYQDGDPNGSMGYDGQFAYYMAVDPDPDEVKAHLDVAAYRYQRILYPLLARLLALGNTQWIPWALILVNILSQVIGTAFLARYFASQNIPSRYALIYGLWVGLITGIGADLFEPLAFAFIITGLYAHNQQHKGLGYFLLGCALFTKETSLPFWAAALMADVLAEKRSWRSFLGLLPAIVYALWQVWLFREFGMFGLQSGGDMATSFEWIPYGGFLHIGSVDLQLLGFYFLIFGPTILLPNLWGTIVSARELILGDRHVQNWSLLLNTLFVTFLPFSTFREPLGLLRISTGMVVSILLFAAYKGLRRPMNMGMFWIALLFIYFR
jgi:hypothetical protein